MRYLVTGCAGFIGSNLVDQLLSTGHEVTGVDNFSTGRRQFLAEALANPRFRLIEGDLANDQTLDAAFEGCETVIHFAANADVRYGPAHPTLDFEQNTQVTVKLLEAMRRSRVRQIAFASTGSVYGEACTFPTPENVPIPLQTSLYGASKMAAECFLQAYSESFGFRVFIFRFVSVLGPRYTHGHVIDFYNQLCQHPDSLHVLGDGTQRKSYLHVEDCVRGVLKCISAAPDRVNIFNLGTDEYCEVNDSIRWICEELRVSPRITYSGGDRGWVGDNPFIFLDCSKAKALGWSAQHSIRSGVLETVRYLMAQGKGGCQ